MSPTLEAMRHTKDTFDKAMAWTHPALIRRYCADFERTPEEGEQCFTAFKQFLVVCAQGETPRVPSRPIDDMWHTALLFSRSYLSFCQECLGEIVHHEPIEGPADVASYSVTRKDTRALFGDLSPVYWPEPAVAELCGSMYIP